MPEPSILCVTVGRGRHRHLIAEHKHLAEQGCKLVELRLDFLVTPPNLKRLLTERPCPVIVTCRREKDGGRWAKSEDERLMLLRQAIAMGVEYVDLEEDIASKVPRFGKTKRIVSYHNFQETPEDLNHLHAKLSGLNADVVKIVTMAHSPHDNLRLMRLMRAAMVPTVAFCMGEFGQVSRILAGKFGAPFTYSTFHAERQMAPGQMSYQQMKETFRYEKINATTEVYGVIADPVSHSLSPQIHNAAFETLGLNKVYVPIRLRPEDLTQFMHDCRELGIRGLSVTIPHKEEILNHKTKCDVGADEIRAANTLVWDGEDRIAYNTDYRAIRDGLDDVYGAGDKEAPTMSDKHALVLGAGGVARAVVLALARKGADVTIASRTPERADELAQTCKGNSIAWNLRHTIKCDILINCTPVGMHPNLDDTPFEPKYVLPEMVVFDTVYNPEQTYLLKIAREAGCRVITGVDMFITQAALQFKYFTGKDPPTGEMRKVFRRSISAVKF